ncbi:class I SAM-dependent methyltransferase [Effusibacillus dendaii]|uniref:Methyltransferase small domain-containing protein n=1 Tax=Effusibacillus dendaii TaxID=2743772 RepID=A0A7I8DAY8_9BACL|nr:class I SAM-dependent methyltransferase [Effusibacillus dendaii]BCJ87348.1 hypothetical protein skT53_23330 [Effusibacillus dendaii]
MADHYFSNRPTAAHDVRMIRQRLRGFELSFWTDAGVFSKGGIDFGSRLLIETMEIPADASVLDVGCGYGPIGIAAAKMAYEGTVLMVDVNERAVRLAQKNVEQNDIGNAEVRVSDLFSQISEKEFDRILTNPPVRAGKAVVHRIFEGAAARLKEGGQLWIVIQKKQGAPSARKKLQELFEDVEEKAKEAGYWIFCCKNTKILT